MKPITPIYIDCIPEKEYLSPEFQLALRSESDGLFIYETSNHAVFTIDQDGIVTITGPGRAYVIITQLESTIFGTNQVEQLIIVNKSTPPITILGPNSLTLENTPLNSRILKIQTISELIQNVFSTDDSILKINRILNDEYELIPQKIGDVSIIVSTRNNYYFNSNSARFNLKILESSNIESPIVLNINTFKEAFKHNAIKEIDILTSNPVPEPYINNIDLTFQQQPRGYEFDILILNVNAKEFVNDINKYDAQLLCCDINVIQEQITIEWDFGYNIIHDYFPYESNFNDRPRINIFRSDGKYLEFVSGGGPDILKIPEGSDPEDPEAFIYNKWGDRNTGIIIIPISDYPECPSELITSNLSNIFYGIDLFTREDLLPYNLFPPIENGWVTGISNPGEVKFQYLFTGDYEKNILIKLPPIISSSSSSFFPEPPAP